MALAAPTAVAEFRRLLVARTAEVQPITPADVPAVAEFLHTHLNRRVTAAEWRAAIASARTGGQPNHGFLLRVGEHVVGAYLAFYSARMINGRSERFCNLGAWCVLPEYRFHSLRLLKALLAQDGYHFTDLSPSGPVLGVNERLGFEYLDTSASLIPILPRPSWPGRHVISADPDVISRTLTGDALELYRDHAATAAQHLVLIRGDEWCYVVFRIDTRKKVRAFASILHVSHAEVFRVMTGPLGRYLLRHHGVVAMLADERVAGGRPRLAIALRSRRRKMFRSASLAPNHIDYLYSELVCVSW